jgi:hypothetical protein
MIKSEISIYIYIVGFVNFQRINREIIKIEITLNLNQYDGKYDGT